MEKQRIAIIGLGRIGSAFLRQILERNAQGLEVVAVAEAHETPGLQLARERGVNISSLDAIVAMGKQVDVVFDLTGLPAVRRELREKMGAAGNQHTVIASETIARVIWALISATDLPVIAGRTTGY
ncbi:NAD(P)-binding domain-containing protein [Curvibacter sp. APW13]|uniref:Gfo/Idh/MocA family oxidoreductase n=1 Tax=Curvibacter sp. APW13 TaxID=3077236 RepID=UPI0028DFA6F9|nr:Gfo/Idh/MocA family oxidoreductase [Curvibacter sp. APW13]MDT8989921.1 NAD(P)-binding domain-containing protein [Curvibacter sp. APW13]